MIESCNKKILRYTQYRNYHHFGASKDAKFKQRSNLKLATKCQLLIKVFDVLLRLPHKRSSRLKSILCVKRTIRH